MLYVFRITLLKHPLLILVTYLALFSGIPKGSAKELITSLLTENSPYSNILSDR
jgi:hypothetical protein